MGAFFQWIATLSPPLVWSMFVFLCLLMVIYPFHKQLKKIITNKLSKVSPEIVDFSWRLTPEHFLFHFKDSSYYITSKKNDFLIEGGKILINWNVIGGIQNRYRKYWAEFKRQFSLGNSFQRKTCF